MPTRYTYDPVHVVVANFLKKRKERSSPLAEIIETLGKEGLLRNTDPVQVRASLIMRNKVESKNGRQPPFRIVQNLVSLVYEEPEEDSQRAKILDVLRQLRDVEKTLLEVLNAQQ